MLWEARCCFCLQALPRRFSPAMNRGRHTYAGNRFGGLPREVRHLMARMRNPEPVSAGAIAAVLLLIAMLGVAALSSRFGLARPLRNEAFSAAVRSPVVRENQSPPEKVPEFAKAAAEVPLKEQPSLVVSFSPTTPEPVSPEEGPPSIAAAESGAQAAVENDFEVAATFSAEIDSPEFIPASSPTPSRATARRKTNPAEPKSRRALVADLAKSDNRKSSSGPSPIGCEASAKEGGADPENSGEFQSGGIGWHNAERAMDPVCW